MCRKAHEDYVNDLIASELNNKKLWSYIRSKNQENSGITDLLHHNKLIQDPLSKADLFNSQFSSVFSSPSTPGQAKRTIPAPPHSPSPSHPLSGTGGLSVPTVPPTPPLLPLSLACLTSLSPDPASLNCSSISMSTRPHDPPHVPRGCQTSPTCAPPHVPFFM